MASIRKRGRLWQVQVRRKDAPTISRSFHLKQDAETWARAMEVDADRLTLHSDPRMLQKITFGDCLTRYRDEVSINKKGHDVERWLINALLRNSLAKRSLSSLKPADFKAYRDERLEEISGSGVNREFAIIGHVFETAIKEWSIPLSVNPIARIRKPPNNPPRERRLKFGELEALLNATANGRNPYIRSIIVIAIETAMRRGEILNIRRRDLFLAKRQLHIPETKTGRPRTIPLSESAFAELMPHLNASRDDDAKLFPISTNAFRLAWDRLKRRARIDDLHFHDLRHEAVSRLFESGLNTAQVAAISGHRDFRMLARYAHVKVCVI